LRIGKDYLSLETLAETVVFRQLKLPSLCRSGVHYNAGQATGGNRAQAAVPGGCASPFESEIASPTALCE
jgi:hypothetical protein